MRRIVAFAIGGSYPEIPDNWGFVQFPLFEDIADMLIDSSDVFSEQLRHLLLRQPDSLTLQPDLRRNRAVGRLVNRDRDRDGVNFWNGPFQISLFRTFRRCSPLIYLSPAKWYHSPVFSRKF